jgi:hypothetical protein
VKVAGSGIAGMASQSLIEKTDKEAKLKVVQTVNGMDSPPQIQTIDLTKPYDPTKGMGLPPGFEGTVKKLKDGTEKVKVAGKDYDTTWASYEVTGKIAGMDAKASIKKWTTKEIPLGLAKLEMTAEIGSQKMEVLMEAAEFGNKK